METFLLANINAFCPYEIKLIFGSLSVCSSRLHFYKITNLLNSVNFNKSQKILKKEKSIQPSSIHCLVPVHNIWKIVAQPFFLCIENSFSTPHIFIYYYLIRKEIYNAIYKNLCAVHIWKIAQKNCKKLQNCSGKVQKSGRAGK